MVQGVSGDRPSIHPHDAEREKFFHLKKTYFFPKSFWEEKKLHLIAAVFPVTSAGANEVKFSRQEKPSDRTAFAGLVPRNPVK